MCPRKSSSSSFLGRSLFSLHSALLWTLLEFLSNMLISCPFPLPTPLQLQLCSHLAHPVVRGLTWMTSALLPVPTGQKEQGFVLSSSTRRSPKRRRVVKRLQRRLLHFWPSWYKCHCFCQVRVVSVSRAWHPGFLCSSDFRRRPPPLTFVLILPQSLYLLYL